MDLVVTHSLMDFDRKGAFSYNIAYVLMNVMTVFVLSSSVRLCVNMLSLELR